MQTDAPRKDLIPLGALISAFSCAFLIPPFLNNGEIVMRIALLVSLILAAYLSRERPVALSILIASTLAIGASFVLTDGSGQRPYALLYFAANAVFLLIVILQFLGRIIRGRTVDTSLLLIAVCVYLAFAAFAAMLYGIADILSPGAIHIPGNASDPRGETTFMYFSIVTLSTLGYGDVYPATEQTRTIAAFEAVTGQIFLTFVVARLVGLHVAAQSIEEERKP